VDEYSGDVVSFAGDAMFVLFRDTNLKRAAERAASCSLKMLEETDKRLKSMQEMGVDALDTNLLLHVGVGAGKIRCVSSYSMLLVSPDIVFLPCLSVPAG
jgi:class 3 adenylate cyclase